MVNPFAALGTDKIYPLGTHFSRDTDTLKSKLRNKCSACNGMSHKIYPQCEIEVSEILGMLTALELFSVS